MVGRDLFIATAIGTKGLAKGQMNIEADTLFFVVNSKLLFQ